MAVARRSGATASAYLSNGTTASLTPSSLPQADDTIVVLVMMYGAGTTWSIPTGFRKIGPTVSDGQSSIQIFVKRAQTGESAPYTFSSTASYGPVVMHTYSGVADIGPISYLDEDAVGGTAIAWPDIVVPVTGGAAFIASTTLSSATFTTPASWTAGYSGSRGKTFDILAPSVGTLTGPTSTASVDEAHTVISMFLTPSLRVPSNYTAPVITGNNWQGQALSASLGDWLGPDTYSVMWLRDGLEME